MPGRIAPSHSRVSEMWSAQALMQPRSTVANTVACLRVDPSLYSTQERAPLTSRVRQLHNADAI